MKEKSKSIEKKHLSLAVDTSSPCLTLALWRGERLLGQRNVMTKPPGKGEANLLQFYLKELLRKTRLKLSDVRVVGFGFGPGSYTGLRIGLTALKGLMLTQPQIKGIRISSLDLIACGVFPSKTCQELAVLVDARREKIYCNFYKEEKGRLKRLSGRPLLCTLEELKTRLKRRKTHEPITLAGDALKRYGADLKQIKNCRLLDPKFWYPKARHSKRLIQHESTLKNWLGLSQVRPDYMRPSEAEEKWGLCYDERDVI